MGQATRRNGPARMVSSQAQHSRRRASEYRQTAVHSTTMLYSLFRPLLFALDPEAAHDATFRSLDAAARYGVAQVVLPRAPASPVTVMGLAFPNRVGVAAGLDKNAEHIDGLAALGFGFIECGTVTPRAQPGNPKPRLFRLIEAEALINRLGFNNGGVDRFVANANRARYRGILGLNIGKNFDTPNERAVDDYLTCLRAVYARASYVAVNISSPNTKGLRELQHEGRAGGAADGAQGGADGARAAARQVHADRGQDRARPRSGRHRGHRAAPDQAQDRRRDRHQHHRLAHGGEGPARTRTSPAGSRVGRCARRRRR